MQEVEPSQNGPQDALPGLTLLANAVESAASGIVITDRAGVIQWLNPAFTNATGYAAHELIGRNIRILKSDRHSPEFFQEVWASLLQGATWRGYFTNRRKDGSEYVDDTTIAPVRAREGAISHFIAIKQPCPASAAGKPTSPRQSEIAAAGHFATGIAPDLSGLLGAITRDTEALIAGVNLTPESSECSGRISRAGAQAAALAGWLLAFSRRQSQQFRRLELNALIIGLSRHLRTILPANIDLEMRLDPVRRELIADPAALEEALIHLTLNSRDAMPDGGTLMMETTSVERPAPDGDKSSSRRYVLLRVIDTGAGMDEIAQTHMFEPFHASNAEGSALGLGLSAVYGIVKQANGWISIQPGKDAGSVVEIYLPMADAARSTTV
jgi:two-component system cell cycle sensor histidine kinase/response regulator CckA